MVEYLLDKGAHVDACDKAGLSPLDYAAMHNNVELVKLLMDYGAKVRAWRAWKHLLPRTSRHANPSPGHPTSLHTLA